MADTFVERRQNEGATKPLGALMNQGGGSKHGSADTLPELMDQGGSTKTPGDPSDFTKSGKGPSLGKLMGQ